MKAIIIIFLVLLGLNYFVYIQTVSPSLDYEERSLIGYLLLDKHLLIGDEDFNKEDLNLGVNRLREKYEIIHYLSYSESQLPEDIKVGDKVRVNYSETFQTKVPQIIVNDIASLTSSCKKRSGMVGHIIVEEKILIEDESFQTEDIALSGEELQEKYQIVFLQIESPLLLEGIDTGDRVAIEYTRVLESYPPRALVSCIDKMIEKTFEAS